METMRWWPLMETLRWRPWDGDHKMVTLRWRAWDGDLVMEAMRWTPCAGHLETLRWWPLYGAMEAANYCHQILPAAFKSKLRLGSQNVSQSLDTAPHRLHKRTGWKRKAWEKPFFFQLNRLPGTRLRGAYKAIGRSTQGEHPLLGCWLHLHPQQSLRNLVCPVFPF